MQTRAYAKPALALLGLAAGFIALVSGCGSVPLQPPPPPKVALLLGGGGARGFAHVGVIRELEAAGVPIHMIVGVSVGSLIGAMYADNPDAFKLEWQAFQIDKKEIFDFKFLNLKDGVVYGQAIQDYIDRAISTKYLEDLKIPLAVVAVDLKSGQRVVFRQGLIKTAVRASVSIPGVFPPVLTDKQILVDGGVLGNLPAEVARDMGATLLIGVNISKPANHALDSNPGALTVVLESINLMGDEIVRLNHKQIDVLIQPDVGSVGVTDFSKKHDLIQAGRVATQAALPQIRACLEGSMHPFLKLKAGKE